MPAAIALPAFWGALGTGAAAAGAIVSGHEQSKAATNAAQIQSDAANKAAELQAKAAADTLAFQKQQAQVQLQNEAAAQLASYGQYTARQQALSSLGEEVGLPARNIPAPPSYLVNEASSSYNPFASPATTTAGAAMAPPTSPGVTAPSASGTSGAANFGGGWHNTTDPVAKALQTGLQQGKSGQSLADAINAQFGLPAGQSLAYYPQTGQYAMPNWYVAPNAQNNGALDLITRANAGGASTGSTLPYSLAGLMMQMPISPGVTIGQQA